MLRPTSKPPPYPARGTYQSPGLRVRELPWVANGPLNVYPNGVVNLPNLHPQTRPAMSQSLAQIYVHIVSAALDKVRVGIG